MTSGRPHSWWIIAPAAWLLLPMLLLAVPASAQLPYRVTLHTEPLEPAEGDSVTLVADGFYLNTCDGSVFGSSMPEPGVAELDAGRPWPDPYACFEVIIPIHVRYRLGPQAAGSHAVTFRMVEVYYHGSTDPAHPETRWIRDTTYQYRVSGSPQPPRGGWDSPYLEQVGACGPRGRLGVGQTPEVCAGYPYVLDVSGPLSEPGLRFVRAWAGHPSGLDFAPVRGLREISILLERDSGGASPQPVARGGQQWSASFDVKEVPQFTGMQLVPIWIDIRSASDTTNVPEHYATTADMQVRGDCDSLLVPPAHPRIDSLAVRPARECGPQPAPVCAHEPILLVSRVSVPGLPLLESTGLSLPDTAGPARRWIDVRMSVGRASDDTGDCRTPLTVLNSSLSAPGFPAGDYGFRLTVTDAAAAPDSQFSSADSIQFSVLDPCPGYAGPGTPACPPLTLELTGSNPMAAKLGFRILLDAPGPARLEAFDALGRRVSRITLHAATASEYFASWPGTGDSGARLPAGIYFLRASSQGHVVSRKIALLTRN